jgi:hypothetical protein
MGPTLAPFGLYVNQDRKNALEFGATSAVNPCPAVAAPAYQLPESAKSALVGYAFVTEQVTLGKRRVNGIAPARPDPSVKMYDSSPWEQVSRLNVAVPTSSAAVAGGH